MKNLPKGITNGGKRLASLWWKPWRIKKREHRFLILLSSLWDRFNIISAPKDMPHIYQTNAFERSRPVIWNAAGLKCISLLCAFAFAQNSRLIFKKEVQIWADIRYKEVLRSWTNLGCGQTEVKRSNTENVTVLWHYTGSRVMALCSLNRSSLSC